MAGLRAINFIYGANGSGKTTISRVIAGIGDCPACALTWREGRALQSLVYNRDFVDANYRPRIAGIFTLGEESTEAIARIDQLQRQILELDGDIANRKLNLYGPDGNGGKQSELRALRAAFEEECWALERAYREHFVVAFTGYRGAKSDFSDKVLHEKDSNNSDLCDLESLKKRVETVFAKGLQAERLLGAISGERLATYETAVILSKRVIGKEDVDVAGLIRKLGNSDWVKQGLAYLPHSEGECPFCQQNLPHDIEGKLGEYFDETYATDIAAIDTILDGYGEAASAVTTAIEGLIAADHRFIDGDKLRLILDRLVERVDANKRKLASKKKEPSSIVTLESTLPLIEEVGTVISQANREAEEQNRLLANVEAERVALTSQIWRFIVEEASPALGRFNSARRNVDAAIAGLSEGIAQKQAERSTAATELQELESSITSVEPTVSEINKLLISFGFNSFRLATAGDSGTQYQILRHDGSDATATLSEGEKTFITFLYFYHLLRGSATESGIVQERIVVIDDPVSSLDSDILFIVSSLIKKLLNEARHGSGLIKQVILLTHNIYFHKEVSFDAQRGPVCRNFETFWIVKKRDEVSVLQGYDRNPIRTSYELLWAEVKNPDRSKLTIQNTLRRILENYFRILGNIDPDEIVEKFEGQERQICAALFSWVHDGSHSAYDDLYLASDDDTVDRFLKVFRKVFEKSDHMAHYRMMMGEAEPEADHQPTEAMIVAIATEDGEASPSSMNQDG